MPKPLPPGMAPNIDPRAMVQFHPAQQEIYVLDTAATKVLYSLDGQTWKEGRSFQLKGAAWRYASALVPEEDIDAWRAAGTVYVKYVNESGAESRVWEFKCLPSGKRSSEY